MSTLSQAVAQVVRSEVAARQLDRTEFARKAGQSKTTAWRKIGGKVKLSIDDVAAFARALGWTTEELLRRAQDALNSGAVYEPDDPAPDLSEHITRKLSPAAQVQVRAARAEKAKRSRAGQPNV